MPDGTGPVLDRLVRKLASQPNVPHAVLRVESGDTSLTWTSAKGVASPDGTPMRPETPYFIASVDKLYTATCVLRLVEAARVKLDAPVATYLPDALWRGIHMLDGVDRSAEITVEQLLGHTSGLADYLEDRPKGGRSLVDSLVEEGDRSWSAAEAMARVREELAPHFAPQDPDSAHPRIRYSDTNYQLLISLIEEVHSEPLATVFSKAIYEPLGMDHTYAPGVSEPAQPLPAAPATLWSGDAPLDLPKAFVSLRSVNSTAADQIASLRGLLGGELFEDPGTLSLMQRRWNRFRLPLDAAALRAPSWPIEYGLGMKRFRLPRLFTPFGAVPAVVGHTGSTGSWLFHCPELDVYLAGTVDQATAGAVPFRFIPKVLHELRRAAG